MDQKQLEDIVRAVMGQIGAPASGSNATAGSAAPAAATTSAVEAGALPDLGGLEFQKNWIGVQNPKNQEALEQLRKMSGARVCCGRVGARPRTLSLLRFLADHSRSKDTVLKEIPAEWVQSKNLLEVQSEVENKDQYLTRPDMGRRLSAEGIEIIKSQCKKGVQVQVIVSDGLSTDAVTVNMDEILTPLTKGLESAGLTVGTPLFVRYGRVKVEDQIGELVGAEVVLLLVGERPGLGQSESLSCYAVYKPTVEKTVEADRTCISNIHKAGTPPVEGAAVIVDLAKSMIKNQASGIELNKKLKGN